MNNLIDEINITKNIFGVKDKAYSLREKERTRLSFDKFFEFQDINNLVNATANRIKEQKARINKIGDKDTELKIKCDKHLEELYFSLNSLRTQRDYLLYEVSFLSHASFWESASTRFAEHGEALGLGWLDLLRAFSRESAESGVIMSPSVKDFVCARYAPEMLSPSEEEEAFFKKYDVMCFPESIQVPFMDKKGNPVAQLSDGRTRLNITGFATTKVGNLEEFLLASCVARSASPDKRSIEHQSDTEVLRSTWSALRNKKLIPWRVHGLMEITETGMKTTERKIIGAAKGAGMPVSPRQNRR